MRDQCEMQNPKCKMVNGEQQTLDFEPWTLDTGVFHRRSPRSGMVFQGNSAIYYRYGFCGTMWRIFSETPKQGQKLAVTPIKMVSYVAPPTSGTRVMQPAQKSCPSNFSLTPRTNKLKFVRRQKNFGTLGTAGHAFWDSPQQIVTQQSDVIRSSNDAAINDPRFRMQLACSPSFAREFSWNSAIMRSY